MTDNGMYLIRRKQWRFIDAWTFSATYGWKQTGWKRKKKSDNKEPSTLCFRKRSHLQSEVGNVVWVL